MCCSIKIVDEVGNLIITAETVKDLIELHMAVVKDKNYASIKSNYCLCSIDIEQTALHNGYAANMSAGGFDWIFKRRIDNGI